MILKIRRININSCYRHLPRCVVNKQHDVKISGELILPTKSFLTTTPLQPVSLKTSTVFSPILPFTTGILLFTPVKGSTQALLSNGTFLPQANRSWSFWIHDFTSSGVALRSGYLTKQPALTWPCCTGLPSLPSSWPPDRQFLASWPCLSHRKHFLAGVGQLIALCPRALHL